MNDNEREWKLTDDNGINQNVKNDDLINELKKLLYLGYSRKIIIERIK